MRQYRLSVFVPFRGESSGEGKRRRKKSCKIKHDFRASSFRDAVGFLHDSLKKTSLNLEADIVEVRIEDLGAVTDRVQGVA